jgi:hypothetical protein
MDGWMDGWTIIGEMEMKIVKKFILLKGKLCIKLWITVDCKGLQWIVKDYEEL